MHYLRGFLSNIRLLFQKYPFSVSLTLFLLGLIVFGSSVYYNLILRNRVETKEIFTTASLNESESETDEGEIAGTETESSSSPTKTPIPNITKSNTKSTPTPTNIPGEVKEVHTKETVEERTVVVVTTTPTPTATPTSTPVPTPTPTVDNTPFTASIECNKSGDKITAVITANKTLKWCEIGVKNSGGGSIAKNRFDPGGNTCSGEFGGDYSICYGSVSSLNDEVISF